MILFVNYDYADRNTARPLIEGLISLSYEVNFFDTLLFSKPGWDDLLVEGVQKCDLFIYLLTSNSLESAFCKELAEYARQLGKPILLVLMEHVPQIPEAYSANLFDIRLMDTNSALYHLVVTTNNLIAHHPVVTEIANVPKPDLSKYAPKLYESESSSPFSIPSTERPFIATASASRQSYTLRALLILGALLLITVIAVSAFSSFRSANPDILPTATPVPLASGFKFIDLEGLPTPAPGIAGCALAVDGDANNGYTVTVNNTGAVSQTADDSLELGCNMFILETQSSPREAISGYRAFVSLIPDTFTFSNSEAGFYFNQGIGITQDNNYYLCALQVQPGQSGDTLISASFSGSNDLFFSVVSNDTVEEEIAPNFNWSEANDLLFEINDQGELSCLINNFNIPARQENGGEFTPIAAPRINLAQPFNLNLSSQRDGLTAKAIVSGIQSSP